MTRTKKLLFIHIPRNAGKSIASALRRELNGKKVAWEHAKLKDVNFSTRGLTKFCVVRNPYERMVSLWKYIVHEKVTYEPRKGKRRKSSELEEIGFSRWLIEYGKRSHDIVTTDTPQYSWMTRHGRIKMDHVIRFENLVEEFTQVTGLSKKHLPQYHRTEHRAYQEYYTPESREFVDRLFAKDIKKWGFKF